MPEVDCLNDPLEKFLTTAKHHGVADEFLVKLLRHNGWSEKEIFRAFTAYYSKELDSAVPSRGGVLENARDAFMYIVNFLTLGFWTTALGQLLWTAFEYRFDPEESKFRSFYDSSTWQMATLIITLPVFLFVDRMIASQLHLRPELYDSAIRKWLTYLALTIAVLVMLVDGIYFLQVLLDHSVTNKFLADTAVLFVIGGGVFGYYFMSMQRNDKQ